MYFPSTIEYKGPIPISLREKIGNKVYGCDDCLSICPWNKFSEPTKDKNFLALEREKDLRFFLNFDEIFFKKYFFQSPILRIVDLFYKKYFNSSGQQSN